MKSTEMMPKKEMPMDDQKMMMKKKEMSKMMAKMMVEKMFGGKKSPSGK